jgi:hypothetical protein
MSSKHATAPRKPSRLPRKGFFYLLIRFSGLLLKVTGLLLIGVAAVGFFFMLVRFSPAILDTFHSLDQQKFAGFVFFMALGYMLIFPIIGLVGVAITGLGLALGHAGTEPGMSSSMLSPVAIEPPDGLSPD